MIEFRVIILGIVYAGTALLILLVAAIFIILWLMEKRLKRLQDSLMGGTYDRI